jgi:hypothetical protein
MERMAGAPRGLTGDERVAAFKGMHRFGLVLVDNALTIRAGQGFHLADKIFFVIGKPGARIALTGEFNHIDHGKLLLRVDSDLFHAFGGGFGPHRIAQPLGDVRRAGIKYALCS